MSKRGILLIIISALTFWITEPVRAQTFDYEAYPRLDFDIGHLDLDLVLYPDAGSVQGAASYEVKANIGGADVLVLHAAHMQINTVQVNNGSADFHLRNDSLFIELGEKAVMGRTYTVSVTYEAAPGFGLLKNNGGTVWASLLPRSTRHWLPVIDHPRVSFSTNLTITVPAGYDVAATGMQMDRQVIDTDNMVFTFRTEQEVPATALTFAAGRFSRAQTSYGLKRISVLAEDPAPEGKVQKQLVETAAGIVREIQNRTGQEFPFEALNIVVLPDHFWETKSWGASVVYLYRNRGDLEAQLRRGIYGQWFGIYQREEQWRESAAVSLYQTALHYELAGQPVLLKSEDNPAEDLHTVFSAFDVQEWNRWQRGFPAWPDSSRKEILSQTMRDILSQGPGVYTWYDYARYWYGQSGQPYFDTTGVRLPAGGDSTAGIDSASYRVDYNYNEMENTLTLSFTARQGMYDELVTLPLIQTVSGQKDTSEVTFTGARDSVIVSVSPMIQSVDIDASARPGLTLEQHKPASFLIYALRNGTTAEERKEAAAGLGSHADDPDLQLAITDFLQNREFEPEVRAALLRSLATITGGASGTEQIFLNALESDHFDVQQTALMALQRYPESEAVKGRVQAYALKSDSLPVFRNAVRVFSTVADTAAFDAFIGQIVRTDTSGHRAIFAIQEWINSGMAADRGVRQTEFYTSGTYDYPVRKTALQILIRHDHTPEDWKARAEKLLSEADPRIRFLVVRGLSGMSGLDPSEVIAPRIEDEYDARVYRAMRDVMSNP